MENKEKQNETPENEEVVIPEIRSPYQAEESATGEQIMAQIKTLCCFDEFASLCGEIHDMAPIIKARNLQQVILQRAYLFAIEPGGGCTTAAWALANLMNADGLVPERIGVVELGDISGELPDFPINPNLLPLLARIADRIVVMDLFGIMDYIAEPEFQDFLLRLQELMLSNRLIPIFQTPYLESDALIRIQNIILDVMNLETVVFIPPTMEEYTAAALRQMGAYGYRADEETCWYLERRFLEEISDGRFYGFKTVRKVVDELVYGKLRSVVYGYEPDSPVITGGSLPISPERFVLADPAAHLEEMPGIRGAAKQLQDAVKRICEAKQAGEKGPIHMQFIGDPGTGKSSAAHVMGQILAQAGVLKKDLVIERPGNAFLGYIPGYTGPLVTRLCRDAYGSVLFVDNAEELCGDEPEDRIYADEAVRALAVQMEAHPDDMLVILAGTLEEMERLNEAYPELSRQTPVRIDFPAYTTEQLADIFLDMITESGLEAGEGFEAAVRKYFAELGDDVVKSAEFTNARYVNNLFESTCSKYYTRAELEGSEDGLVLPQDFAAAAIYADHFNDKIKRRFEIGFHGAEKRGN